jgi:hypothetical protein
MVCAGVRYVGHKLDIRRLEAVAKEFKMDYETRREFGDFVEDCKRKGDTGSGPRGDFTYQELREKAREFLEE